MLKLRFKVEFTYHTTDTSVSSLFPWSAKW